MEYNKLEDVVSQAWFMFYSVLEYHEIDSDRVLVALDSKDCFNDVFSCIMQCVEVTSEDD